MVERHQKRRLLQRSLHNALERTGGQRYGIGRQIDPRPLKTAKLFD
jgi:hypothetical protein